MIDLDQPSRFSAVDHENMLSHIDRWADQCKRAWDRVQDFAQSLTVPPFRGVLVLGMGGSAIGGDLLAALAARSSPVPIQVNRDYTLPDWVGDSTLVIGSSYSGSTEETLAAFKAARRRGCRLLALSSGGELADLARQYGAPWLHIPYKSQPRAALGYSLIFLIGLGQRMGLLPDQSEALEEAIEVLNAQREEIGAQVPVAENQAKQLALELRDHLPVIYGAGILAPVARRWKTQINENAKSWALWEEMPEFDHNTVASFGLPKPLLKQIYTIALTAPSMHPRHRLRFEISAELIAREGIAQKEIEAQGGAPLAQMVSAIQFGDYVSYYLAMLYEVDPTEIPNIQYLKRRLGDQPLRDQTASLR
ncbi:MAG: bifunctional phosphoglucose/phosphomannose isomerase [Chloroflexota bacterium]|nr:bifunctional phosphoglucose/phosphomannose isomerase [Chloroflexota bacterium]